MNSWFLSGGSISMGLQKNIHLLSLIFLSLLLLLFFLIVETLNQDALTVEKRRGDEG